MNSLDYQCAPIAQLHRPDIECQLVDEKCHFYAEITAETMGNDLCRDQNPTCVYKRNPKGMIEGNCQLIPDKSGCLDKTGSEKIDCFAKQSDLCRKQDSLNSCVASACYWRSPCTLSPKYCRDNCEVASSNIKGTCGRTTHFHCSLLNNMDPDILSCTHLSRVKELDSYCIKKAESKSDRLIVSIVFPVILLITCLGLWQIPALGDIQNRRWGVLVPTIGFGSLLAAAFLPTFLLANDYAFASGWSVNVVTYSPHWLLFVFFFLVLYFGYHVQHHLFLRQATPRSLLLSSVIELIVEVMGWASLVGIQTRPLNICLWSVMAIITCMWRQVEFVKDTTLLMVSTLIISLLFPTIVYIVNAFILVPISMTTSCGFLTVFSVIQAVSALWRIDETIRRYSYSRMLGLVMIVCIACGLILPVVFYYSTYPYIAWAEDFIKSYSK